MCSISKPLMIPFRYWWIKLKNHNVLITQSILIHYIQQEQQTLYFAIKLYRGTLLRNNAIKGKLQSSYIVMSRLGCYNNIFQYPKVSYHVFLENMIASYHYQMDNMYRKPHVETLTLPGGTPTQSCYLAQLMADSRTAMGRCHAEKHHAIHCQFIYEYYYTKRFLSRIDKRI